MTQKHEWPFGFDVEDGDQLTSVLFKGERFVRLVLPGEAGNGVLLHPALVDIGRRRVYAVHPAESFAIIEGETVLRCGTVVGAAGEIEVVQ